MTANMPARSFDVSRRQTSSVSYFWPSKHSTGSELLKAVSQTVITWILQSKHMIETIDLGSVYLRRRRRLGAGGDGSCIRELAWDHLGFVWTQAPWPWPGLFAQGRGIWVVVWLDLKVRHWPKSAFKDLSRTDNLCVFLSGWFFPTQRPFLYRGIHIWGERAVHVMVVQHCSERALGATLLLPVLLLPKLSTLSLQLFMGNNINHTAWFFANSSQSNHRLKCRFSCSAFISKSDFEHLSAKVRFKHNSCNIWEKEDLFRWGLCQSAILLLDSAINYCCNYLSSWTFKMSSERDDYIF